MNAATPRLFTLSWREALAEDRSDRLALVRISVGSPRWARGGTKQIPYLSELAPEGLRHIEDPDEFEHLYRQKLDDVGVDALEHAFQRLIEAHGRRALALLCFEPDRADCHRGTFAQWWLERTGEVVPEWSTDSWR